MSELEGWCEMSEMEGGWEMSGKLHSFTSGKWMVAGGAQCLQPWPLCLHQGQSYAAVHVMVLENPNGSSCTHSCLQEEPRASNSGYSTFNRDAPGPAQPPGNRGFSMRPKSARDKVG
jgi:hypothetical protein